MKRHSLRLLDVTTPPSRALARAITTSPSRGPRLAALSVGAWLAATLGGCLDTRQGQVGVEQSDTSDVADARDDADLRDTAVGPDTALTDTTFDTSGPDACRLVTDPRSLEGSQTITMSDLERGNARFVDPLTLVGTRNQVDERGVSRSSIVAVELPSGAARTLVSGPGNMRLADARDGALLGFAESVDTKTLELFYAEVGAGPSTPKTLLAMDWSGGSISTTPGIWAFDDATHAVERGLAAWAEHVQTVNPVHRVRLYRAGAGGGALRTLVESPTWVGAPVVHRGRVLWSRQDQPTTLWVHDAERDRTEQVTSVTNLGGYTLSDDAAWWLDEGRVFRKAFDGSEARTVEAGPCAMLVSDGNVAAAVCGPEAKSDWLFATGQPVAFVAGAKVPLGTFTTGEARLVASLTVRGDLVAWLEYPLEAACDGRPDVVGDLVITTLSGALSGARPTRLTGTKSGCWCCNAIWPAAHVDLTARALTWNYPLDTDEYPYDAIGVGWFPAQCAP
ncbi:MAG: hypothetical protein JNJ59_22930 [Deltaproteobacteria bacterium]|nr:hypothetical protein [Deltaproteobacteria bacterium]